MWLTVLFWSIVLSSMLVSRWIAGVWRWSYFFGGLLFGIYNEFVFEQCWDYSPLLGPFLWRDVSLLIIVGWGNIGMLALTVSDRIQKALPQVPAHPGVVLFAADIGFYCLFGMIGEIAMAKLGYWKYNFPQQAYIPLQILGYLGVALQVSSLGRRIESIRRPS